MFKSSSAAGVLVLALSITCSSVSLAAAPPPAGKGAAQAAQVKKIEEGTRLQIFLDNANFGPGKIDGRGGAFTQKALTLYRQSVGLPAPAPPGPKGALDISGMDLSSVTPVFVDYTITKEDGESVGKLPTGPVAQSKVKWLPYQTLLEAVSEKFHCDPNLLKELNPGKAEHLKVSDTIKAPNVKPFELSSVKSIKPGENIAAIVANELGEEAEAPAAANEGKPAPGNKDQAGAADKQEAQALSIHVSTKENILEVLAGEKLVAAFPVTVGSKQTVSPIGSWTVKAIAKLPNFRYDLKMLNEGKRSSNSHLLPPGPNNPVGVMWIALNKKGIGIHGTEDPDSIGRSASHGCIRLANWDVVKLAVMVKPGMHVVID